MADFRFARPGDLGLHCLGPSQARHDLNIRRLSGAVADETQQDKCSLSVFWSPAPAADPSGHSAILPSCLPVQFQSQPLDRASCCPALATTARDKQKRTRRREEDCRCQERRRWAAHDLSSSSLPLLDILDTLDTLVLSSPLVDMPHAASKDSATAGFGLASPSASTSSTMTTVPAPAQPTRPRLARPSRLVSSASFHAGAPIPTFPTSYSSRAGQNLNRRRSTLPGLHRQPTHKYHTFPTQPPKTPSDAPDSAADLMGDGDGGTAGKRWRRSRHRHTHSRDSNHDATPLPIRQLVLLALLSICEQTALNSIGPYLPTMVASFPGIPEEEVGLYVGLLASSFAMAQLLTNFLWGYISDRVGRKPVMLAGTAMLTVCFAFFGFCRRYWQVLVVHMAMGLLNGNAAVVPTVLGELTDRSNQSKAFIWLPVIYSLGGITGPALGGLLVGEIGTDKYPFLGPNIMSTAALALAVVVLGLLFQETLEDVDDSRRYTLQSWAATIRWLACLGRDKGKNKFGNSQARQNGSGTQNDEHGTANEEQSLLHASADTDVESQSQDAADRDAEDRKGGSHSRRNALRQLLNWTTISILFTYLIFQVANISFNSLYPIFSSTPPPTGRGLTPGTIGVSLSLAGIVTIIFQISLFERIKARLGNLGTFRLSLLGLALCMALIPWVGYKDGRGLFGWIDGRSSLLAELGVILVLKNLSAVGGLSCVLLLITNSAPSHETLGTLNGIAQTLSAAGRSFGPLTSGAVFSLSTRLRHKGELLAFGLFGGVAFLGWLWTLAIKGGNLESEDYIGDGDDSDDEDYDSEVSEASSSTIRPRSASARVQDGDRR
ncbi:major facilitator superfamily domain-containing protein [Coniella lustricola]|uniref:Major facilitator superfamily domain-containing protein n=1 Tax=Coniella lustricola TaxID=2025994 RepID=A0A2T2ZZI1_9PEZI|nr:major facilitator superfamily domain-containing protein [Coniella lustricola]